MLTISRTLVLAAAALVTIGLAIVLAAGLSWRSASQAEPGESLASQLGDDPFPTTVRTIDPDGTERVVLTIDDVSPAQADALADGVITWEEYEAAVWVAFTCMTDAGLEVRETPRLDATGTRLEYSVWTTRSPSNTEERAGNRAIIADCETRHLFFVRLALEIQQRPSSETLAAARDALAGCLRDAGVPASEIDEGHLLATAGYDPVAFGRCSEEVSREYGLPYFAG